MSAAPVYIENTSANPIPVSIVATASGTMILISSVESQTSHTVSNADTDVTTIAIPVNTYTYVQTEVEGYITSANNSTKQVISLKILYAAAQVGVTMLYEYTGAAAGGLGTTPFFFKATAAASNLTAHVTQGAAATDATTTVFINAVRIYGIV